jgi:hypothetical protein
MALEPPRAVVAATDRLTYDAGEAQQMRAFVNAYWSQREDAPPGTLSLQWIALVQQNPSFIATLCSLRMEVTNTGPGTVEIQSLGVRLVQDARPTRDQFHLIDVCSLFTEASKQALGGCPPALGGGPTACGVTGVSVSLDGGVAGTVYKQKGKLTSYTCPPLILGARESTDLRVSVTSTTPFTYPLAATIDVTRGNDHQTLTLTGQAATLAYASAAQVSCNELQGASLTLRATGEDVFRTQNDTDPTDTKWRH